ncbi:hypothetical protein GCM10009624_30970 [Gordonia sinesedis]
MDRLQTMGAYGWDEPSFIAALREADPDVFVDVRRRRGVRGSRYAFANSNRLQQILADLGIRYVHRVDLAPSNETRDIVARDIAERGIGYRDRNSLAPAYVDAYQAETLTDFDSTDFAESLGPDAETAMLFCVEGIPDACHRSMIADRLTADLDIPVEHVRPPEDVGAGR